MFEEIQPPELTPEAVRATGAYSFAVAVCLLTFTISFLIWRLVPLSRSARAEARYTCIGSVVSLGVLCTLLSAEFMISMLNQHLGIPDWRSVLDQTPYIVKLGEYYLEFVRWALIPLVAAMAILGFLSLVFLPAAFIVTLIHGVFQYAGFLLVMVGVVATMAIFLARIVQLIALIAKHSYFLIAAGVAAFPVKWLRGLGISLIVFGLVMFYGLPVALGMVQHSPSPTLDESELVKARLLDALNKESVPVNLYVSDMEGYSLPWSYITMNSSVEYTYPSILTNYTLPSGSYEVGWISEENLTVARHNFTYTRFYNGSAVTNIFQPSGFLAIDVLRIGIISIEALQGSHPLAVLKWPGLTRTVLYKETEVEKLWFMGFELNATPHMLHVTPGVDMEHPDPALKNINSTQEYYDYIYSKSPIVVLQAPTIDSLNLNSTAIVFYSNESYWSVERLGKGDYLYRFNLTRVSYHCWVSRVENVTDPKTNETKIIKYYKAKAEYYGEAPEDLYTAHLPDLVSDPKATIVSYGALDGKSFNPYLDIGPASPGNLMAKDLIIGYGPLELEKAYRIEEEFERLGESQAKTAEEAGYLPGEVVPEGKGLVTHVVEEPRKVTLDPNPTILYYRPYGNATRISSEKEGSCPSLPMYIPVEVEVKFEAEQSQAWNPMPLMVWEPMEKANDTCYHLLYEQDPKHPQLEAPNMYQSPLDAALGGVGLIPLVGEMIKWAFAIAIPLMVADAASSFLGGYSFAGTLLAAGKQLVGAFVSTRGLAVTAFTKGRPSVTWLLKRPQKLMEEQLLIKLQQEKMRAMKEGDTIKVAYASKALDRYLKAQTAPSIAFAKTEKKIGRWTIPWIKVVHPRSELMSQFNKEASKLFPEEASLLQKVSKPGSVKVSRAEALKMLEKASREGWAGTAEANELAKAMIFGKGRVNELTRSDVKLSWMTKADLKNLSNPIYPLIWGMFVPHALPAARASQLKGLESRASFSMDMGYLNQKNVAGRKYEIAEDGTRKFTGGEEIKRIDAKMVKAHIEYDRDHGFAHIHDIGGRDIEVDLKSGGLSDYVDHKPDDFHADDYLKRVEDYYYGREPPEDIEEPATPFDEDLARSSDVISEHTYGFGHDWWWEAGEVHSAGALPEDVGTEDLHDVGDGGSDSHLDYFIQGGSGDESPASPLELDKLPRRSPVDEDSSDHAHGR